MAQVIKFFDQARPMLLPKKLKTNAQIHSRPQNIPKRSRTCSLDRKIKMPIYEG